MSNFYTPVISANGYPYHQLGNRIPAEEVLKRLFKAGINGFDLLYGEDSFPQFDSSMPVKDIVKLKTTAGECGGTVSAVTLVSFDLASPEDCIRQIRDGIVLAHVFNTPRLNLLPRENGITHGEGFRRFEKIWKQVHNLAASSRLIISAENHTVHEDKDRDVFLIRDTGDLLNTCYLSGGFIRLKYDPAWLC
jgi:hypothetical protein